MGFCLLLAATVSAAAAGRTAVPFGYAWRFHYGDDPSSPPDSGPGTQQSTFEEDLGRRNSKGTPR